MVKFLLGLSHEYRSTQEQAKMETAGVVEIVSYSFSSFPTLGSIIGDSGFKYVSPNRLKPFAPDIRLP